MENVEEIWKDVPNYEGKYQASSLGRIRSLDRKLTVVSPVMNQFMDKPIEITMVRSIKGRVKKLTIGNHGYPVCNLGLKDLHTVHTLVAKAFLPRIKGKNHVDHINSIRTDNRVKNLQWVTQQENNAKQRYLRGEERSNKLTDRDVRHIRDEHDRLLSSSSKAPATIIARGYGISRSVVSSIVDRKSWKHVV